MQDMYDDTYITWYMENNRPANGELELQLRVYVARQKKDIYRYPGICKHIV